MIKHPILLDRNENQFGPAPACLDVLQRAGVGELSAYSRDYERKVKSRLSERLANISGLPEERILLSYGSEDMIKQAVHCYLSAGQKILVPSLSWWYYRSVASEVNGITVEYPISEEADAFSYDIDALLRLQEDEKPKVILVASPNNPTGNSISLEHLRLLLRSSAETVVIVDEAYSGFSSTKEDSTPELASEHDTVLILRTFSKFYALAGIRIGYAIAGKKLHRLVGFSARYLGYNRLSEEIALAALDSTEYYSQMKTRMLKERDRYVGELRELPGWRPYRSKANFLLARIPDGTHSSLRRRLEEKGVHIKYYTDGPLHDSVRITVGREEQNQILLSALREFSGLSLPAEQAVRR